MLDTRELRIGCHLLCGSIYNGHKIPSHYAEVYAIGKDWVEVKTHPEQGDPEEYEPEECEGIPITDDVLICLGFKRVRIEDGVHVYRKEHVTLEMCQNDIQIFDSDEHTLSACHHACYLHTLEGMLIDCGMDFNFDPYENKP